MAQQVTDSTFAQEVLQKDSGVVLVDFWAPWCGPCRMLGPIIEELAAEYDGKVKVVKLNVDENPQTAGQFRIMGIPTMLLFNNGKVVEQMVGVRPKAQIATSIEKWLAA